MDQKGSDGKSDRKERLARSLRANLRRRKEQSRQRQEEHGVAEGDDSSTVATS